MRLCLLFGRNFEETFENAQQRKVEQSQPIGRCILSDEQFEDTFAQRRKNKRSGDLNRHSREKKLYPLGQKIFQDT